MCWCCFFLIGVAVIAVALVGYGVVWAFRNNPIG